MENASKALIMASGILIGILILSLAAYLISTFGAYSAEIQKRTEEKALSEFNSQFTVYEGRTDLTIYDVITVANYAKENNDKYNLSKTEMGESTFYINVECDNQDFEKLTVTEQNEKLSKYSKSENIKIYKCKVNISKITGRVYQVVFTTDN